MCDENYKALAVAIVEDMITEYKKALRRNSKYRIDYCERWFKGDWCYFLSGMDGDYIIKAVRKVVEDEKNSNRRNDSKAIKKIYRKINKKSQY